MTETPSDPRLPSDAELISSVRSGDAGAFGELFSRHVAAARGLARRLTRNSADVDDLVSEAFENTLKALRAGRGPDEFFRAYLLTVVSNTTYRHNRKTRLTTSDENLDEYESLMTYPDPALATFEAEVVAKAFASLPERWQAVLWHTEIDEMPLAEVGALLGMSANAVAALAHRAREGLREAYLQAHINTSEDEACRTTARLLGRRVRRTLSRRDAKKVDEHLKDCLKCSALALELEDVGHGMRVLLFPLVAGVPFAAPHLGLLGAVGALLRPRGTGAAGAGGAAGSGAVTVAVAAGAAVVIGLGTVLGVGLVQQARHDDAGDPTRPSAEALVQAQGPDRDSIPAPAPGASAPPTDPASLPPVPDPEDSDPGRPEPQDTDPAGAPRTPGAPTAGDGAGGAGDPVLPPAGHEPDGGQPTRPGIPDYGATEPPATDPGDPVPPIGPTDPPATTPTTDPPVTDPPVTDPPPTDPPATDPPVTDPPPTDPPVTDPPAEPVSLDTSVSESSSGLFKHFTYTIAVPAGKAVKDATVEFRLSGGAIFLSPPSASAGWSCTSGGLTEASCRTTGPLEGSAEFQFDVLAVLPTGSSLTHTVSGDGVETARSEYTF